MLYLETIERLLHPDYVIVQPGGRIERKAEALARTGSGIAASTISKMNICVHYRQNGSATPFIRRHLPIQRPGPG